MARVVAIFDDLLLGSNVHGWLAAGGHDVTLAGAPGDLPPADVIVVDLNAGFDGIGVAGSDGEAKYVGVYQHTDVEIRTAALDAGFDLVVPRSRMAREGAELVDRLCADTE